MMVGNAQVAGPEIIRHVAVPSGPASLLDVGGGHGAFAIQFCQAHPGLQAQIMDTAVALNTARAAIVEAAWPRGSRPIQVISGLRAGWAA